jgi:hypothetical protein
VKSNANAATMTATTMNEMWSIRLS